MHPKRTYLPSINNQACSIAEIVYASKYKLCLSLHCAESLKHDNIDTICLKMSDVY